MGKEEEVSSREWKYAHLLREFLAEKGRFETAC